MLAESVDAADHYVAVAEIAVGPFPEEIRPHVEVIPNGVELDRLTPTAPRQELRARLGIPAGSLAVGFVGRFCDDKDPLAAARAVSELPGATAVYCGVGWADGEFKPPVERLTRGRVRWAECLARVGVDDV